MKVTINTDMKELSKWLSPKADADRFYRIKGEIEVLGAYGEQDLKAEVKGISKTSKLYNSILAKTSGNSLATLQTRVKSSVEYSHVRIAQGGSPKGTEVNLENLKKWVRLTGVQNRYGGSIEAATYEIAKNIYKRGTTSRAREGGVRFRRFLKVFEMRINRTRAKIADIMIK